MREEPPACAEQGYSSCGTEDYREAQGTSFATPQVSAAAAVLLSLRPLLRPEQVTTILERSAADLTSDTGCDACPVGRDSLSGWGRLDVAAAIDALSTRLPTPDSYEPNDNAGSRAYPLWGQTRQATATVDYWDDQDDVYSIYLRKGQGVYVGLVPLTQPSGDLGLALWLPATRSIDDVHSLRMRVRTSARPGGRQYFSYRAPKAGSYYVQVRMSSPGTARYRLTVAKG